MLIPFLFACQDYSLVNVGGASRSPPHHEWSVVEVTKPLQPQPQADKPLYAHTRDVLFSIDPETGLETAIGWFGTAIVDIAIDEDGNLYGGSSNGKLWSVDASTGQANLLCSTDLNMYAMTFISDRLVIGSENVILEVNLRDCSTSRLSRETSWKTSGDVVGLPDKEIYWTVRGDTSDQLVVFSPSTSIDQLVGTINGYGKLFGLAYANDLLYGFSEDGSIIRIDDQNGTPELLIQSEQAWWGATTNPVTW